MAVSLKKQTPIMREITPVHLIDEEDTIVKPVRSEPASKPETLKIEVVGEKQLPVVSENNDMEENEKRGKFARFREKLRDIAYNVVDFIPVLVVGLGLLAIIITFGLMFIDGANLSKDLKAQNNAVETASAGIIVDKRIENPRSNAFHTTNTEYRLYINVDYYSGGEKKTVKKYFSVPESTYLAYDIGDYFNSHNFSFSDEQ